MSGLSRRFFMGMDAFLIFISITIIACVNTFAAPKTVEMKGNSYVFEDGSRYAYEGASPIHDAFFYGEDSLGAFSISGDIGIETNYNEIDAYEANGDISFNYSYDGKLLDRSDKERWHLDDSHDEIVNGVDTTDGIFPQDKINTGVIIIQNSKNQKQWKVVGSIYNDFFDENKDGKEGLYISSKKETINGMYYRVTVAYQLKRRIKKGSVFSPEEYEYKECVEVYEFYVCANENPIRIHDLTSRKDISSPTQGKAYEGFYIDRNGSENDITVTSDINQNLNATNLSSYTKKGVYTISIKTKIGRMYTYTVEVTEGIDLTYINPKVYVSKEDSGFSTKKEYLDSSLDPLSSLKIGVPPESKITAKGNNYSILTSGISLFLSLSDKNIEKEDWAVVNDDWGKKKNQRVGGVHLGQIGKGAVLVQTSNDGENWKHAEKAGFIDGFKNTDVLSNYGTDKDFLLYTPDGKDILKGIYIRVLFAYQVRQESSEEIQDRVDKYSFYLCSNNLGAATVHNITVQDNLEEHFGEQDEITMGVYRSAETLTSGSGTVNGFIIDTSNIPSADYTVLKDGEAISKSTEYTETGRYDVTFSNNAGEIEERTFYVDRLLPDESLKLYFGESFIRGKRIFTEEQFPVYEGGESSYNLEKVPDNFLPIMGKITNISTGESLDFTYSREARSGDLESPGEYIAEFFTQQYDMENSEEETEADDHDNTENAVAGDVRKFTFHFRVIPNGTAPGPKVNQAELEEYDNKAITDCYPIFYCVKRQSASKGEIRIAFSNEKDAIDYAYNYEKGTVEEQKDGTYRYRGAFQTVQKEIYDSEEKLNDAIYDFARQAVTRAYFDLSDPFTYRILDPEIGSNIDSLQAEKLSDSIVFFEEGQKELLVEKKRNLEERDYIPIINDKAYAFLNPEKNPQISEKRIGFQFTRDDNGYDSESVVILDSSGKEIPIEYGRDVESQLLEANCATGIVTINEKTCYGDETTYKAVFFNKGENTAAITLGYEEGGSEKTVRVDQEHSKQTKLIADSFSIVSVEDELDPYNLIIVKRQGDEETFFCADQMADYKYLIPGLYSVKVLNRMGYSYSFSVEIPEKEQETTNMDMSTTETKKNDMRSDPGTSDEAVEEDVSEVNETVSTVSEGIVDQKSVIQSEKESDSEKAGEGKKKSNALPVFVIILLAAAAGGIGVFAFRKKGY